MSQDRTTAPAKASRPGDNVNQVDELPRQIGPREPAVVAELRKLADAQFADYVRRQEILRTARRQFAAVASAPNPAALHKLHEAHREAMPAKQKRGRVGGKRHQNKVRALAARDGAQCAYCSKPFADLAQATLDHVIPHSIMRTWANWNLVLACGPCNNAKSDRLPPLLALLVLQVFGDHQFLKAVA